MSQGWDREWICSLSTVLLAKQKRPRASRLPGEIEDAVGFARERLAFEPDETQAAALRGGRRGIVLCTRQWGKSTVMAVKAVHRAYTEPGSLVLALAPSERQSAEFVRKAAQFVRRLRISVRGDGDNATSIAF